MQPRKFSLAHLTILDAPPPALIRIAARAGYDFVGLRLIPLGLPGEPRYEPHEDVVMRREIKAAIDETGVRVLDVELARILEAPAPESYLPAFETAAELGAEHVLSSVWIRDRNQVIERFARLCDVARPLGLTVNLEFVSSTEWNSLDGVLDVVTNCPSLDLVRVLRPIDGHGERVLHEGPLGERVETASISLPGAAVNDGGKA